MALITAKEYRIAPSIIQRAEQLIKVFDDQCRTDIGDGDHFNRIADKVEVGSINTEHRDAVPAEATPIIDYSPQNAATQTSQMDYDGDDGEWERSKYNLSRDVAPILTEMMTRIKKAYVSAPSGVADSVAGSVPVLINSDQDVPASLEGFSCVYVLHIYKPNVKVSQYCIDGVVVICSIVVL